MANKIMNVHNILYLAHSDATEQQREKWLIIFHNFVINSAAAACRLLHMTFTSPDMQNQQDNSTELWQYTTIYDKKNIPLSLVWWSLGVYNAPLLVESRGPTSISLSHPLSVQVQLEAKALKTFDVDQTLVGVSIHWDDEVGPQNLSVLISSFVK